MDVVNRVSDGRHIAYVHHRLWPALVRRAPNLGHARPARLREVHTKSGAHRTEAQPFPGWVPNDVRRQAGALTKTRRFARWGSGLPRSVSVEHVRLGMMTLTVRAIRPRPLHAPRCVHPDTRIVPILFGIEDVFLRTG